MSTLAQQIAQLEQGELQHNRPQYMKLLQQQIEQNSLDSLSLSKLAELIQQDNLVGVENVEIERQDPKSLFEKAL
jgi:hypothetical protein